MLTATAASPSYGPLRPGTDRSGHGTEAPTPARLAQGRMGSGPRPRVPRPLDGWHPRRRGGPLMTARQAARQAVWSNLGLFFPLYCAVFIALFVTRA